MARDRPRPAPWALAAVALTALLAGLAPSPRAEAGTPAVVVEPRGFLRPEEGQVFRLYQATLGRPAEPDGFGYWVGLRVQGVPLAVVAESFLASQEFAVRFDTASDDHFVDLLYQNVLGRAGDPGGVAYWRQQLAGGATRAQLVVLFSESAELQLTTDTTLADLPPFRSSIATVSAADLPSSWRAGCPVGPADLRAVEVSYLGFDGQSHQGTLVVHRDVADAVSRVFGELYQARFPIAGIRPVDDFGGDDGASMAADNTSAFNCRRVTGGAAWSRHAYGRAIDVNPVENPYVVGATVLPAAGAAWVDRSAYHPGMIRPGDAVTRAFAAAGWRWGGDFTSLRDYQHFQR